MSALMLNRSIKLKVQH